MLPMLPITLLTLGATAALASASNPARIEIDLVFPKGKTTYNNMTVPPVVFALQNAPTAKVFDYQINWEINGDRPAFFAAGSFASDSWQKQFNYTAGNVGILADSTYWGGNIKAGEYTLSWEYSTTTCTDKGDTMLIETGNVRTGRVKFTIVDDGSGADDLFSGCPQYLGAITAKDPSDSCPELVSGEDGKPDPCQAKMNKKQIACLESYFKGKTDMDACTAAFDDIKPGDKVEWEYAKEARKAGRHAGDDRPVKPSSGWSGSSSSSGSSTSESESEDTSDDTSEGDDSETGKTQKSIGAVVRPGLWVLSAIVIAGTVLY
ncbi:hypothetical protein P168DRAFT_324358 [Aspergillus campestris IBT 28561]|uniref:DUF7136 domain-containing protein n=1 Tax=Aspergillus campestris (strain IBT 28561) TaxID=1392248 RepID=A0A2I1DHP1_ASPC2|nr:uncharacterized protein P168DRAFT_324358 [Aspergillus campestris IBT 28561]PKY09394.1 hypothetical protein P168DRAFT_324358 [Aspergillus campestris IBT 28561]